MQKILFFISLLYIIQFNYAQKFLFHKPWKAEKFISKKTSQIFTLVFTKQKDSILYGTISDYTTDDSSHCSALFEARILPNKKLLVEAQKMTINKSSKKHKHILPILMLEINKESLKGSIAREGSYITLLLNKKEDSIIFIPEYTTKQESFTKTRDSILCTLSIVDNDKPDKDMISISINDKKIIDSLIISKEITTQNIKLIHGKNKVVVTSIDEGEMPPTTMHISIKQEDSILLNMPIFLKKGEEKISWINYPPQ